MLGQDFYFQTIKRYIKIFGILFNNINIARTNAAGDEVDKMKVPLTYAVKDKMLARLTQDPNIGKKAAITLPRMSFEMTSITYDGDRVLPATGKNVRRGSDANHMKMQYTAAAFNFGFTLYIYYKDSEDGTKILEQIMPFFRPAFTVKAKLIDEMDDEREIPIILNGANPSNDFEGEFEKRTTLVYTLSFTLKGYLFGPIMEKPIIKFVQIQSLIGTPADNDDAQTRIMTYPGLTANGEPTSNSSLTIDANLIEFDDDYGDIVIQDDIPFTPNTYPFDR